jgi:hypothetical protein
MKALITSFVSLLLGLVIGWYIEHRHAEHEMTDVLEQSVQAIDSGNRLDAVYAMRAIEIIESGQTQNAVRFLCKPIADYYYVYTIDGWPKDERSIKLRAQIKQFTSTNQIVAEEMTNRMLNYKIRKTQ